MARWSQSELNQELLARGHKPTDYRTRGGHRLWVSPNGRHFLVPDWDGEYDDETFDDIIRAIYKAPVAD